MLNNILRLGLEILISISMHIFLTEAYCIIINFKKILKQFSKSRKMALFSVSTFCGFWFL